MMYKLPMLGPDFSRRSEKRFTLQSAEEVSHLAVVQAVALLPVRQVVLVAVQRFFETLGTYYRVCHRFRLTKRDDYFELIFSIFILSVIF